MSATDASQAKHPLGLDVEDFWVDPWKTRAELDPAVVERAVALGTSINK